MLRPKLAVILCLCWCAALLPARAVAGPTLLFEAGSGRVLYAEDADDQWHPASLTKIMTAYLTFHAIKAGKLAFDTAIPYSEAAALQPSSKIGLPVGATITVDLALQALIIKSANDIAVALSEAVGGSEAHFVELMNATARRLGMTRTVFRNPHGLPAAEQVTTARDLARLSAAAVRDFPEHAGRWAQTQMQIGNIKIVSHNGLFKSMEGTDGLKTGFICDSGFNIVASATRDNVRLMAVVLGETTPGERNQRAQELIDRGFDLLGWKAMFTKDTINSMALSPAAKNAASIRTSMIALECNNRRVARVVASRNRAKARKKAEVAAAAKKPATATAVQATGATAGAAPTNPATKGAAVTKAPQAAAKASAAARPPAAPAAQ